MKLWMRLPLVLGFICVLSAGGVASVYILTKDRIRAQELKKREEALELLFGKGVTQQVVNEAEDPVDRVYQVLTTEGQLAGYMAIGTGQGYSSKLRVMVGMTPDLDGVKGIKVLHQNETPGLGTRVEEVKTDRTWLKVIAGETEAQSNARAWFQEKFAQLPVTDGRMAPEEVQKRKINMTGATITSNATKAAVNDAIRKIIDALQTGSVKGSDG